MVPTRFCWSPQGFRWSRSHFDWSRLKFDRRAAQKRISSPSPVLSPHSPPRDKTLDACSPPLISPSSTVDDGQKSLSSAAASPTTRRTPAPYLTDVAEVKGKSPIIKPYSDPIDSFPCVYIVPPSVCLTLR